MFVKPLFAKSFIERKMAYILTAIETQGELLRSIRPSKYTWKSRYSIFCLGLSSPVIAVFSIMSVGGRFQFSEFTNF